MSQLVPFEHNFPICVPHLGSHNKRDHRLARTLSASRFVSVMLSLLCGGKVSAEQSSKTRQFIGQQCSLVHMKICNTCARQIIIGWP